MQPKLPVPRRGAQGSHTPLEDDSAVVDHDDVLAEVLDEVELVAGEKDDPPTVDPLAQGVGQARDGDGVEAGEGLVEHDDLRLVDEGGRQLEPLLHPPGQFVGAVAPTVAQPELLEEGTSPRRRVRSGQAVQTREMDDLLPCGHRRIEAALLRHVAPRPAVAQVRDPLPIQADLTPVGGEYSEQDAHQGRLAGAVGAEQAGEAARLDGAGHARQGLPLPEGVPHVTNVECHRSPPYDLRGPDAAGPGSRRNRALRRAAAG